MKAAKLRDIVGWTPASREKFRPALARLSHLEMMIGSYDRSTMLRNLFGDFG